MVGYTFDLLSEAIFYLLRTKNKICAKFDAHTYHHCQEIHNNKYFMGLLLVAMATIEVDSV